MKTHEIESVARLVVEGLGRPSQIRLLGCGSVSSAQAFSSQDQYACQLYQCGGQGDFSCCDGFNCLDRFLCPADALYGCDDGPFGCLSDFQCAANYAPTGGVCD